MVVSMVVPPDSATSSVPLWMVSPLLVWPEVISMISEPPLDTTTPSATAPASTPPLSNTTPLMLRPEYTITSAAVSLPVTIVLFATP